MNATLIKKIELENGLTLEFTDVSRKVAGDRYLVVLQTRVTVPVEEKWFPKESAGRPELADIIAKVGTEVVFEQRKERNFVDEREKPDVLADIVAVAEDYGIRYIGHPDFPQKLILKKYQEA